MIYINSEVIDANSIASLFVVISVVRASLVFKLHIMEAIQNHEIPSGKGLNQETRWCSNCG